MLQPGFYSNVGNTIDVGDQSFEVAQILREGKNIMQALKVHRVMKKMKTKNIVDPDRAFVLKIFKTEIQCAVARRAYEYWRQLRDVLKPVGFPEIHHCDDRFVVSDFIEGEVVEGMQKIDTRVIVKIMVDVAQQIDELLKQNMAHGDVKPANMVRTLRTGTLKTRLIDMDYFAPLGSIKIGNPPLHFGTPGFMAPEQMIDGKYERGTDIFALGKSALRLINHGYGIDGKAIFSQYGISDLVTRKPEPAQRALAERHLFRSLARKDGENEDHSRKLVDFIMKSTAHDSAERPQSAQEVRQLLAA